MIRDLNYGTAAGVGAGAALGSVFGGAGVGIVLSGAAVAGGYLAVDAYLTTRSGGDGQ